MGEAGLPVAVLVGAAFALGACVGSFLNVVVWRLPRGESLLWPGSRCPACKEAIPFWANVPVVAWFALRGRCRSCGARISARYPLVEALTGALFAGLLVAHGPSARLLVEWGLAAALVAVTFIDLDHHIIPNQITLPGVGLGLALGGRAEPGVPWREAVFGALIVGRNAVGGVRRLRAFRRAHRPGHGRREARGDARELPRARAGVGRDGAGSLIGLAYGIAMIAWQRTGRGTRIPFGPALAVAGLAFLFQPDLLERVLGPR
jgi:leader peptidase (prepilin peptidase)/N-methyltransferase